jgi:hypothetical protein
LPLPSVLKVEARGWFEKLAGRELLFDMKLGIGKAIPIQAWRGFEGSRRLRLPDFMIIGT